MKVFEVITERVRDESKKIHTQRQYVTADEDDFALVATYFKNRCEENKEDLIRIAEVATVVQHIER